eukprot:UN27538
MKPYMDLLDEDPKNICQDGFNLWPKFNENNKTSQYKKEYESKVNSIQSRLNVYFQDVSIISFKLNEAMASGLHLDRNYFVPYFNNHTSFMRLNYYPVCSEPDKHLGISPHHDAGWLTVLYADPDVKSLQVSKDKEWHQVEPIRGAFVINTGDMAQVWSNDRFVAP